MPSAAARQISQTTTGPARKMKRPCRLSRDPSPRDEPTEYDFSMRGQSTVQVRRIERAGSWPLPSRTVRCDDEPRRPHGGSSCAMKPEFTGQVIFQATFAARPGISHVLFDFDGCAPGCSLRELTAGVSWAGPQPEVAVEAAVDSLADCRYPAPTSHDGWSAGPILSRYSPADFFPPSSRDACLRAIGARFSICLSVCPLAAATP